MCRKLIVHIVGARPNFIKLAALYPELCNDFDQLIVHTGQHYDYEMSKVFFEEFEIPEPNYDLDIGSGSHGYQTGEMLKRCEKVIVKERPKLVIVYGDTNSTLAGALASVKLGIPVAHVEAGLRCGINFMPEEINRVLVDHISEMLFAPTKTALENLRREGINEGVYFTGDIMLDLFLNYRPKFASSHNGDFILATVHRAENTDIPNRFKAILEALLESNEEIIFPMHPRTKKRIEEFNFTWFLESKNIKVINPLSYIRFLRLMSKSKKVVTDSGGVQKEAYFMGKPCITLREKTEWIETVSKGWNMLVGANKDKIVKSIRSFNPKDKPCLSIFGDGKAAEKMAETLNAYSQN